MSWFAVINGSIVDAAVDCGSCINVVTEGWSSSCSFVVVVILLVLVLLYKYDTAEAALLVAVARCCCCCYSYHCFCIRAHLSGDEFLVVGKFQAGSLLNPQSLNLLFSLSLSLTLPLFLLFPCNLFPLIYLWSSWSSFSRNKNGPK